MKPLNLNDVTQFVEDHIGSFHERRLNSLQTLKLKQILKRKNPYLFKAKNLVAPHDLVKSLLDAHLSSQEEAIFGEFLENLAIFVCNKVYEGKKSSAEGVDLEFERDGLIYLVSIKSGPNWGNSSQIKRMIDNFKKAQRILRTSNSRANIICVNGCCYGQDRQPDKGDYRKLCGQAFWELISNNRDLYVEIITPLGFRAKQRNDDFSAAYSSLLNTFTWEFTNDFCVQGNIDWEKLVKFNSQAI
jgi:hypothetical protein